MKFVSHELDVGSAGYSGTVRFNAYKLDGTRMWTKDINLGRNVYSSAHTAQFLVYDFDGDGKAEMTVQTSLGSTDSTGAYVSNASADSTIKSFTKEQNEAADYRGAGNGRIIEGEEFLTIFNGETGEAIDTIDYPTKRVSLISWGKNDGGNRSQRFLADVAYLDGEKPYAVYWRGYYDTNGRTGVSAMSFDGKRLSVDYIFDTKSGQTGYTKGNEKYTNQGNHNMTVADVDNDGKDEFISGALCFEVNDDNKLMPKWCSYRQHGDALHIGDYDPTHDGLEYFSVHEHGATDGSDVVTDDNGNEKVLDYGMTVYDAATGEELAHYGGTKDTGRGMMANVGSGGYYQITGSGTYQCNGGTDFTATSNGMGNNFRIFWDGDLYDELLNGTSITSYDGRTMSQIFNADGCVSINTTKANPALQADLFGDWREEVVYPLSDSSALRVYTTTTPTSYKMKSLMYDRVYRMGVAAEQTTYNQPPHIGYYLADECFYGNLIGIKLDTDNAKTTYRLGEALDTSGLKVTASYSDNNDTEVTSYSANGYDPMQPGEQTITINYLGEVQSYTVNVLDETGITASCNKTTYKVGEDFDKSSISVNMVYDDGSTAPIEDASISAPDTMAAGTQTLTVSYQGAKALYTDTVTIEVVTDVECDDTGAVTGYHGSDSEIVIPSSMESSADYEIKSINGSEINLYMKDIAPNVFAAAYDDNGALKAVKQLDINESGDITVDAGFDVDRVFIWDNMEPVDGSGTQNIEINSIKDGAFSDSSLEKIYIYNDTIALDGDNIFPSGVTLVCTEGSTAYEYAVDHAINTEILSLGDEITFDEEFYQSYSSNMLMQTASEGTLAADFVTYHTHAADSRAPWFKSDNFGFKINQASGNRYLYVNAGIYDSQNSFNQVYITFNEPKSTSEKQTVSFDITFPSNSGSPYVELQNESGNIIDTISVKDSGLATDTQYRYELSYDGGYTSLITKADGTVVKEKSISASAGSEILSTIAFKQDFNMSNMSSAASGIVYIDNILIN